MIAVPVQRCATCRYCGDEQLAWVQNKSGKWYLARAYRDGDFLVANPIDAHRCPKRADELNAKPEDEK